MLLQGFAQSRSKKIAKFPGVPNEAELPLLAAGIIAGGVKKRKLKVMAYARYSTDTQNENSVDDQFSACRRWMKDQGWDVEITYCCDRGISGELENRPGINQVKQLIVSEKYDIVIAEDVSRFYRNQTFFTRFVYTAKDAGVRVICINDDIDSNHSDWELKIAFSGIHHAYSNKDTALRIKRAMNARWENGDAMSCCRTGYKRFPKNSVTEGQVQKGSYRDVKDERWTPVIREIFERIARGDSPKSVAKFATESCLPKVNVGSIQYEKWTSENIRNLIRNPIYKGVEQFGKTHTVKRLSTGRHIQVKTDPSEILYRDMPHLAHVDPILWQRANDQVDGRRVKGQVDWSKKVLGKPKVGCKRVMRDKFTCNICGGQMISRTNRKMDKKFYHCANGVSERCWNKTQAPMELTHENIMRAIIEQLRKQQGFIDLIVAEAERINRTGGDVESQIKNLESELKETQNKQNRISNAISEGGELESLLSVLQKLEEKSRQLKDEIKNLESQRNLLKHTITREEVLDCIESAINDIAQAEDAWSIVRPLIAEVRAVPFQRIDNHRDVLHARIRLNLLELIPQQWRYLCENNGLAEELSAINTEFEVDIFELKQIELHAVDVYNLRQAGVSVKEVCKRLNVTRANYDLLLRFWKRMVSLGATEMFRELTHCPERLVFGTIPEGTQHMVARDYKPQSSPAEKPSSIETAESEITHKTDSATDPENKLGNPTSASMPPDEDSSDAPPAEK